MFFKFLSIKSKVYFFGFLVQEANKCTNLKVWLLLGIRTHPHASSAVSYPSLCYAPNIRAEEESVLNVCNTFPNIRKWLQCSHRKAPSDLMHWKVTFSKASVPEFTRSGHHWPKNSCCPLQLCSTLERHSYSSVISGSAWPRKQHFHKTKAAVVETQSLQIGQQMHSLEKTAY